VIFIRAYLVEPTSEETEALEDLKSTAEMLFDERLHKQGGKHDFGRCPITLRVNDDKRRLDANQIPSIKRIGDEVYLSLRPGGIVFI
jgi:hypothetical protein